MKRKVDSDYVNRKSRYKHFVLGCCVKCRRIEVYRVTEAILVENHWGEHMEECRECGGLCGICILGKYQKPPGFARKCKKCDFRFTCATIRVEEIPAILIGQLQVEWDGETEAFDVKEQITWR